MTSDIHVNVSHQDWTGTYPVWLIREGDGGRWVGAPCAFFIPTPGDVTAPTFSLSRPQAQALMNQLWSLGLRPGDGDGAGGKAHVEALKEHIADLRRVAFRGK